MQIAKSKIMKMYNILVNDQITDAIPIWWRKCKAHTLTQVIMFNRTINTFSKEATYSCDVFLFALLVISC